MATFLSGRRSLQQCGLRAKQLVFSSTVNDAPLSLHTPSLTSLVSRRHFATEPFHPKRHVPFTPEKATELGLDKCDHMENKVKYKGNPLDKGIKYYFSKDYGIENDETKKSVIEQLDEERNTMPFPPVQHEHMKEREKLYGDSHYDVNGKLVKKYETMSKDPKILDIQMRIFHQEHPDQGKGLKKKFIWRSRMRKRVTDWAMPDEPGCNRLMKKRAKQVLRLHKYVEEETPMKVEAERMLVAATFDPDRMRRLEKLKRLRERGKGPPKKGMGKRAITRQAKAEKKASK